VSAPFVCQGCGDSWATDPRLVVPCPVCGRGVGVNCIRPSGHYTSMPHAERRRQAFEVQPCRCLALWEEANPDLVTGELTNPRKAEAANTNQMELL
jgi:hypothetical protein